MGAGDSSNVISFLDAAQRQSAYGTIPQFDIKGSVTQWDENVIRTQKDAGIGFQSFINLGASGDAAASILGLDLSMLTTEDMSVLPGVTSRNSAASSPTSRTSCASGGSTTARWMATSTRPSTRQSRICAPSSG